MLGDADGKVPHTMPIPVAARTKKTELTVCDDFRDKPALGLTWPWNHNPDNTLWSLDERQGWLRLKTGRVVGSLFEARNTLIQRAEGLSCSVTISLDVSQMKDGDRAGLAAYRSERGAISVVMDGDRKFLVMSDRQFENACTEPHQDRI